MRPPTTYSSSSIIRRLLGLARPYWLQLFGVIALTVAATPLTLLYPLPLKIVVDNVVGSAELPGYLAPLLPESVERSGAHLLAAAVGLLLAVTVLTTIQWTALWMVQTYTAQKLVLRFRALMFLHAQRLSLSYHDTQGSTDSTYRIQNDAHAINTVLLYSLVPLLTAGIPLVFIIGIMLFLDWQLTLVALGVAPFLIGLVRSFGPRLRLKWNSVKGLDSGGMGIVQETLSSLRLVKAFGRENHQRERFMRQSETHIAGELDAISTQCNFEILVALTVGIGTAGVLWLGTLHVLDGILTLGELLMVMAYVGQLFGPLRTMSKSSTGLASGLASAERAFALLDQATDVQEAPHARQLRRATGDLTFQAVSFSYLPGQTVLKDVEFSVRRGARVGIHGRTGSGKSTLLSLLMRFYDPTAGTILLDGLDLREYRLSDLRNQFAMVLQDPVLFSTTIKENISYARPDASDEEIVEAARLASAQEFISALPDGYLTRVGERGLTLSGGERQRISLARAFLKNAPILILDEPTSAVDLKTEAAIMDAVARLMEGRTSFLITHRLSLLELCDLHLEVEQGTVSTTHNMRRTDHELVASLDLVRIPGAIVTSRRDAAASSSAA